MNHATPARLARLALLAALSLACLDAQSTGEVTGVVTDPTLASVPKVSIRLVNTQTGSTVSTQSNSEGIYRVPNLLPGTYKLTASAPGFSEFTATGITVDVGRTSRADVLLNISSTQEQVTVTAGAQLLDLDNGAKGQVISSQQIENLPLETRNPVALIALTPGVVPGNGGLTQNRQGSDAVSTSSFYVINGGTRTTNGGFNEYLVDGLSMTNRRDGTILALPSAGSIQQFQVQSGGLSAEFGQTVGGVINYVTKSGTNQFHGLLFEDYRGTATNARRALPAVSSKPTNNYNQFGGNAGGPILIPKLYNGRNRTFFFVDYDGSRWIRKNPQTATIPTALMHSGNFSDLNVPIYDPNSSSVAGQRTAFPGNMIPASRFSAIGKLILDTYPLPNLLGTANNYLGIQRQYTPVDDITGRIDHSISDRQRATFKLTRVQSALITTAPLGLVDAKTQNVTFPTRNYTGSYTFTINPTLVYSATGGYTVFRRSYFDASNNTVGAAFFGFSVVPAPASGSIPNVRPRATFDIYDPIGTGSPQNQVQQLYQLNQSLSKVVGKHVIRIGADMRRYQAAGFVTAASPNGTLGFAASQTGNGAANTGSSAASLLLGLSNSLLIQQVPSIGVRNYADAFFVADDYKITPSLTLNLGLRYEFETPVTEQHNRVGWFDTSAINPLVNRPGVFQYAGMNGNPRGITSGDYNNVAPRAGFAYVPSFDKGRSVLRGAFGVYYGPIPSIGYYGAAPGYDATLSPVRPNSTSPAAVLTNTYTLPAATGPLGAAANLGLAIAQPVNRQAKNPEIYEWNIGIQRELARNLVVEALYSGNRGVHLISTDNIDLPPQSLIQSAIGAEAAAGGKAGTAQAFLSQTVANPLAGLVPGTLGAATVSRSTPSLPFPHYPSVTGLVNNRDSVYHSFQAKLEKRLSSGVTFLFSYTFSKLIDDTSPSGQVVFGSSSGDQPNNGVQQNPYNLRDVRAVSPFDRPHVFSGNLVYKFPFGKGERWLSSGIANVLAGGFSLTGILSAYSGAPLAITQSASNGLGVGSARPDVVADPEQSSKAIQGNVNSNGTVQWINPAAYAIVDGRFGTSPARDAKLRGPGFWQLDLGLQREFKLKESARVVFRAEAFNSLNHTNLSMPQQDVASPGFGQISVVYDPRIFQFSLQIRF